jgi:hypothetical protein
LISNAGGSPLELERSRRRAETPLGVEGESHEEASSSADVDEGLDSSDEGPNSPGDKSDTDESANAGGSPSALSQWDYWRTLGDYVIRVHVVPRREMFIPTDAGDPPPLMSVFSIAHAKPSSGTT